MSNVFAYMLYQKFIKTLPIFQPLYGIWLPVFFPQPSNLQLFIKLFEKHKEKE